MPKRGSTTARGYGWAHQRERAKWVPKVKAGLVNCWRCGQPIQPNAQWDLGHLPGAEAHTTNPQWAGPEHVGRECAAGGNRATKGRNPRGKGQGAAAKALDWFTPKPPGTLGA